MTSNTMRPREVQMEPEWVRESEGDTFVEVDIQPGSKRSEILGFEPWRKRLKIAVRSPPVDGAANVEVIELMAEEIGIKKADVSIVTGQSRRWKTVKLRGDYVNIIRNFAED